MVRGSTIAVILVLLLAGVPGSTAGADFKVIVNAANPVESITKGDLSKMFLRKTESWPNGQAVIPIDLAPDSPIRESFSTDVHDRKVASIKSYWQRQIFSGKAVPPVEYKSEVNVITFVTGNPGAIGYVANSTRLDHRVKVLEVKD